MQRLLENGIPFVLLLLLFGCGYGFSVGRSNLPRDIRSVYVEPFVNKSNDVGIEEEIASSLRSEFRREKILQVADRPDEADAILTGVVRALSTRVVAVSRKDEALLYEVSLVVDLSLRKRASDQLLWRTEGTVLKETYSGSRAGVVASSSAFQRDTLNAEDLSAFTDIQLTETFRHKTRNELVGRFARALHQKLVEMF